MNKTVKIIVLLALVIVILGIIFIPRFISTDEKSNQKQNTGQPNQSVSVDIYVIQTGVLDNDVKAIGTIRANEEAEIRSELSRKIRGIYFKEGTFVNKGQTLFTLDSDDLIAKLHKQEIDFNLADSKLKRQQQLYDKGLTSQEEFEVNENTLEQIQADMEMTRIEIARTYIRAPFSGIIGLRNISRGSYVSPGIVLVTIQDVSKVKIDFSIPEKYIYLFKKGQGVTFKVDGIEGEFSGEVYANEPKVENNTRSLVLRAMCNNPGKKLMPGTFANVTFKITQDENAILIPTQSLVPRLSGQSVYVIKDGKAKSIDVETGERTEEFVQITSNNINAGDTIITTNILRLKNDTPVKVNKRTQ